MPDFQKKLKSMGDDITAWNEDNYDREEKQFRVKFINDAIYIENYDNFIEFTQIGIMFDSKLVRFYNNVDQMYEKYVPDSHPEFVVFSNLIDCLFWIFHSNFGFHQGHDSNSLRPTRCGG